MSSQVTNESFNTKHIKLINKLVKKISETRHRGIQFQNLRIETMRVISISDASFAGSPGLSSHFWHIILLGTIRHIQISWSTSVTSQTFLLLCVECRYMFFWWDIWRRIDYPWWTGPNIWKASPIIFDDRLGQSLKSHINTSRATERRLMINLKAAKNHTISTRFIT